MQQSAHSSELKGFIERPIKLQASREFLLQVLRLKIKDYPLNHRAIFEITYYSPLSCLELINLNTSDIDVEKRTIKLKRGNETVFIPMTKRSTLLLKKIICSSVIQSDTPLFINDKGERITLSNLWFIKSNFSIETDSDPP